MKTETEFERFFQTELLGDLHELENKRLKIVGKVKIFLFFEFIIFIGLILFLFWLQPLRTGTKPEFDPFKIFWIFFILIILGIIFIIAVTKFFAKFKIDFKEIVIRKIIGNISKDIIYSPKDKIELNEFKSSGIFKTYNADIAGYLGRDLISSKIGDISYRFSWLTVSSKKYETSSYTSTKFHTTRSTKTVTSPLFNGIFFVADFGTSFQTNALIWPNMSKKLKLGGLVDFLQNKSLGNRINLEDTVFEQEYAVYGEDIEAIKKIISPGLRQWIMDFRVKTGSQLYLSFTGPKMNLAVSLKKNFLEPPVFKKINDYNFIFENYQYLLLFNGLLEDLSKKH